MRRGCGLLTLVMMMALAPRLSAQEGGPEVRLRTGALELTLGGRVHAQMNTTTAVEPTVQMLLRRVRIEMGVRANELVSGRLQADFAGDRVVVRDAYVQLDFAPGFRVLAGNAHRPFSLVEMTSSNRILPVERGLRLRGVSGTDHYVLVNSLGYSDRDVGLQVLGAFAEAPLQPTYRVGFFRGPIHGLEGMQDTYQLAGRVTARPAERVTVGLAASSRSFARPASDRPGAFDLRRGNALSLDLELGSSGPGLRFLGELATGDYSPFQDWRFTAAQGWLSYRSAPRGRIAALEPGLRVSHGSVDSYDPGGTLITPGLNIHLGGLNRVMLNYDIWLGEEQRESGAKVQFQMAF